MPQASICRMCLVTDVRMIVIAGTPLQYVYEKMTEAELLENMKPTAACYICHAMLRRCQKFITRSVRADELLTDFLINNKLTVKAVARIDRKTYNLHQPLTTKVECHDNTPSEADDEPKVKQELSFEFVGDGDHDVDFEDHTEFPLAEPVCQINEKTFVQPEAEYLEIQFMKEEKEPIVSDGDDNRDMDSEDEQPLTKIKAAKANPAKRKSDDWRPDDLAEGVKTEKAERKKKAKKRGAIPTRSEEKIYRCVHCPASFGRDYHLRRHVQTHTGEKPHQCTYCRASFIQLYHLKRHILTHTGETPFACNFCPKRFKRDDHLKSHLKTHHVQSIQFKVEGDDDKKLKKDASYEKPFAGTEDETKHDIDASQSTSKNNENDETNSNDAKTFLCYQCGAKFSRRYHLDRHFKSHVKKIHACDFCPGVFNDRLELRAHIKTHDDAKYECHLCQRKFTIKKSLENHLSKHGEGPNADENSDKKTKTDEPVICNVCGVILNRQYSLKIHMVRHTGEKPFECNICHRKFTQKGSMTSHMKKHTGDKPYECDVCHWKFYSKGNLNTHMVKHSEEKPHECDFCHRKFKRKDVFKMHQRLHTGETPFECHICLRKFALKKTMKRHVAKHKEEKGPMALS